MSQAKRLSGKTAIITGASGTIGAATASVFAEAGANVLLVARDESKLAAVAQTMPASQVSFVAADIATAQGNQLMAETALQRYGAIDVFYALAGVTGPMKPLTDVTEEEGDTAQY